MNRIQKLKNFVYLFCKCPKCNQGRFCTKDCVLKEESPEEYALITYARKVFWEDQDA